MALIVEATTFTVNWWESGGVERHHADVFISGAWIKWLVGLIHRAWISALIHRVWITLAAARKDPYQGFWPHPCLSFSLRFLSSPLRSHSFLRGSFGPPRWSEWLFVECLARESQTSKWDAAQFSKHSAWLAHTGFCSPCSGVETHETDWERVCSKYRFCQKTSVPKRTNTTKQGPVGRVQKSLTSLQNLQPTLTGSFFTLEDVQGRVDKMARFYAC